MREQWFLIVGGVNAVKAEGTHLGLDKEQSVLSPVYSAWTVPVTAHSHVTAMQYLVYS